jgi:starch synthase
MVSYELAGIAQAGGLGEAVSGLAKTLARDYGMRVTVFLPSHGQHRDEKIRDAYGFKEISTFIASGYRTGVNRESYRFLSGLERAFVEEVEVVLVKGLDDATSKWLDNSVLYNHNVTFEKMALFSRTLKLYVEYLLSTGNRSQLPDLIHSQDWHMVPAGVVLKQRVKVGHGNIPLVFTIHLLSHMALPWHFCSEEWCGVSDQPISQHGMVGRRSMLTTREVYEKICHGSLEKFGSYLADYVTSVSDSYLKDDVSAFVDGAIKGKSGYIYNGCDWDYDKLRSDVLSDQQFSHLGPGQKPLETRQELRNSLLTRTLSNISQNLNPDNGLEKLVEPFDSDGPLVLMTGRLTPQKGVDLLLEAVPHVKKTIPHAKFLLFLLQSGESHLEETISSTAGQHQDSVRVIYGKHPAQYIAAHLAADVYVMPSRSEPFGISALEAMATGNPVVATRTGGLRETILDISVHREKGTGLLVPVEDVASLVESLVSLLLVTSVDEQTQLNRQEVLDIANRIPVKLLRKMVLDDQRLGSKLRSNCIARVETDFRWINAGRMALERYRAAADLSNRRA